MTAAISGCGKAISIIRHFQLSGRPLEQRGPDNRGCTVSPSRVVIYLASEASPLVINTWNFYVCLSVCLSVVDRQSICSFSIDDSYPLRSPSNMLCMLLPSIIMVPSCTSKRWNSFVRPILVTPPKQHRVLSSAAVNPQPLLGIGQFV